MSKGIERKKPTFRFTVLVILSIVALTAVGMVMFDANIITMFMLSWLIVVPASMKLGYTNSEIEKFAFDIVSDSMQSNMIILSVGVLIGTWIAAGTIPAVVYSGLIVITPKFFLLTTLIICSLTSLATGTSWGTVGTSGIAMMSIGTSMGIPVGLTAGAIISGAYFGDKMSPLSDSTNLAAAVCKTNIITHIKHMMYTTVPAYTICIVLYTVIGFKYASSSIDYNQINSIMNTLDSSFNIGFISVLPILFLLALLLIQKPAIISILASSVLAAVIAIFREGQTLGEILNCMFSGYSIETGLIYADKLLNRGGVMSMAETVIVVLIVFMIAGILQKAGFLEVLLKPMTDKIGNSKAKLVGSTFIISYCANAFSSSMMFTIVFAGTAMKPIFREFNLKPENLSRMLEDTATMGAPLIPWNSNAVFCSQTLGVSPFDFIPYCFLNWITPIISFIYGVTGLTMKKYSEEELEKLKLEETVEIY